MIRRNARPEQCHEISFSQIEVVLAARYNVSVCILCRIAVQQHVGVFPAPLFSKHIIDLIAHLVAVHAYSRANRRVHVCGIAAELNSHLRYRDLRYLSERSLPSGMHKPRDPAHRIHEIYRRTVAAEYRQDRIRDVCHYAVHELPVQRERADCGNAEILFACCDMDIVGVLLIGHELHLKRRSELMRQDVSVCSAYRSSLFNGFRFHDSAAEAFDAGSGRLVIAYISRAEKVRHAQSVEHFKRQIRYAVCMDIKNMLVV